MPALLLAILYEDKFRTEVLDMWPVFRLYISQILDTINVSP